MKKAPRMKDIQNLIASYTANGITAHTYDFSSCNAHDIALILKIDRTNVSRVLNQLHRENRLIKLQGRPTLYLDAGVIHSFSTEPVPYTLPVGRDIQEYLHQDKPVRVREHSSRQTLTYTGSKLGALCPLWRRQASFSEIFYRKGEGAAAAWQAYTNTGACAKRCGR